MWYDSCIATWRIRAYHAYAARAHAIPNTHTCHAALICDMTHSYVRFDLCAVCDMTRSNATRPCHTWAVDHVHSYVTWLTHEWQDSFMCDMAHALWHDPFKSDMLMTHTHTLPVWFTYDATHSWVTRLIHVWYGSFIVTWLFQMRHAYRAHTHSTNSLT